MSKSAMRYAFSTMPWGPRFWNREHLEAALEAIARAGFDGVEVFQAPSAICGIDRLQDLLELLDKWGLQLCGLMSGTPEELERFCCGVSSPPGYWGIQDWRDPMLFERQWPCPLALHAHAHRPGQGHDGVLKQLQRASGLQYLPDTAHLYMEGLIPSVAIAEAAGQGVEFAALHVKDWVPVYGRTSHRYARGFCEPGFGEVCPEDALERYRQLPLAPDEGRWVVVEVNFARVSVYESLRQSAQWLAKQDAALEPKFVSRSVRVTEPRDWEWLPPSALESSVRSEWEHALVEASLEEPRGCFQRVVRAAIDTMGCRLAGWWTCSLTRDEKSMLASAPTVQLPRPGEPFAGSLAATAISERRAVEHDLDSPEVLALFKDADLKTRLDLKRLVVVPVLNSRNPNHVRSVLMLYPGENTPHLSEEQWFMLGQEVALAGEASIESYCSRLETKIHALASRLHSSSDLVEGVRELVKASTGADEAAVFLVDDLSTRLVCASRRGTMWHVQGEHWYTKGIGLVGNVWESGRPLITSRPQDEHEYSGRSSEVPLEEAHSCLIAPMLDHDGSVVGVVRCTNSKTRQNGIPGRVLTDEEAALVEVICLSAVNHLLFLRGIERRRRAKDELRDVFYTTIPHMLQELDTIRRLQRDAQWDWEHRFPRDIRAWCERLRTLVDASEEARSRTRSEWKSIRIVPDVVAPIIRGLQPELNERRLPHNRIDYSGLESLPPLTIDYAVLHGIVFNLLDNAIKYAGNAANRAGTFCVRIWWSADADGAWLHFDDSGIGIREEDRAAVFQRRFRAPAAVAAAPEGQGLGMHIAVQDASRFGGTLTVSNLRNPTRVSLFIPRARFLGSLEDKLRCIL